jgi:predicted short-subunit dehydrogenase-like oxidoreductase (DUF2520 family)
VALPTLNIIGCGRVGQTLAHLWQAHGIYAVQDVVTRSAASAQAACAFIGGGTPVSQYQAMRPADVWLLGVPDMQLAHAAAALAMTQTVAQPEGTVPVIFHCSGALGADVLTPLTALGWQTASAHCILSFASAALAVAQFPGTPCALEGNPSACKQLHSTFTRIGAQCFNVASADKLLYHAAAVFATNFLPVLQAVAEDAWRATGVPETLIPGLRSSLLHNAVANVLQLGPQGALTGPAARGDTGAIARQAQVVSAWDQAAGAAYTALSTLALRLKQTPTD